MVIIDTIPGTNSVPISRTVVSTTVILVILVVVFFIIGVLGCGALVVHGCYKWKLSHQSKHHLPPTSPQLPPAPLYEDIEISTVINKCEVNKNVAYGIVIYSQVTMS